MNDIVHPVDRDVPLFSVVIIFYNCARFIRRAVDSVLAQPGDDYELVLVDDGSTDTSVELLGDILDDPRVSLLQQANAGPAVARNSGAAQARGEFVYYLDCDDMLLPDAMPLLREALAAEPAVDFLVGGYVKVLPDGTEKTRLPRPLPGDRLANFRFFLRKKLGCSISHGATLVRRTAFERLRYPPGIQNNDIVFFAHMLATAEAAVCRRPLCRIYVREGSQRTNMRTIKATGLKMVDAMFDPKVLPTQLMDMRAEFYADRCLSQFRLFYMAGETSAAKNFFHEAVRSFPRALLRWSSLLKYLRLLVGMGPSRQIDSNG